MHGWDKSCPPTLRDILSHSASPEITTNYCSDTRMPLGVNAVKQVLKRVTERNEVAELGRIRLLK